MINLEGQKRIVVTGVGIVGPLGCGLEEVWKRLLAGRSGIRNLPDDITEGTGVAVGGQADSHARVTPEHRTNCRQLPFVANRSGGRMRINVLHVRRTDSGLPQCLLHGAREHCYFGPV